MGLYKREGMMEVSGRMCLHALAQFGPQIFRLVHSQARNACFFTAIWVRVYYPCHGQIDHEDGAGTWKS